MNHCIGANGVPFTDEDVERWTNEAEDGFPNSVLTHETPPWRKSEPMETRSLRVPSALWSLLEKQAKEHGVTTSEYARQALAQGLLADSVISRD